MKKVSNCLRDSGITVFLLLLAFAVSLLCQKLDVEEHTTTVFVFAVFLISLVMAVIVAILAIRKKTGANKKAVPEVPAVQVPAQPAPAAPGSAGQLKLHNVEPKTAAMLMAIVADKFLQLDTLLIMGLGLAAFIVDTAGGVLFAKFLNLFMKNKVNPMIGAAGISAFPMSGRIVHKMAQEEDPQNFLLMHSIGVNVSGQIASVIAGGIILNIAAKLMGG